MRIYILNPPTPEKLYPFSLLRNYAELRVGLHTIQERYQLHLNRDVEIIHDIRDIPVKSEETNLFINASFIPDQHLIDKMVDLKLDESLIYQDELVAISTTVNRFKGFQPSAYTTLRIEHIIHQMHQGMILHSPFDMLICNERLLSEDIESLGLKDASVDLSLLNRITGTGRIIVEKGVKISGAFLNAETGPIYIGNNVTIMEGASIRGPVAILDHAVVKMGAKIYGTTLIGKKCVVGGEIKNSVFFDYSNKAHDGYIGDSVIGSWCNLGAGTSCSNLKNNAGDIHIWNPLLQEKNPVGKKCGVLMGDHTRTAINTSLNSGTVTGICCNIVKAGFPPKYIPDFTWDVDTGSIYHSNKMLEDVHNWMEMKNEKLEEKDKRLLLQHYHHRLNFKE